MERKRKRQPSTSSEDEDTETKQSEVPPQKEKKKLQSNPLLITFINDQIKKCSGCETYFEPGDRRLPKDMVLKYVSTDQDHFQMEHGVKTGGKHQHTFMLLTWPVYAELKS